MMEEKVDRRKKESIVGTKPSSSTVEISRRN